jgi:hypothetical protein
MIKDIVEKLKKEFAKIPTVAGYILALLHETGGGLNRVKLHVGLYILSKRIEELGEALEFCVETGEPRSLQVAEELVRLEAQGAVELGEKYVVLKDSHMAETSLEKLPPEHREAVSDVAKLLKAADAEELKRRSAKPFKARAEDADRAEGI